MNELLEQLAKQAGYYQDQDFDGARFDAMPRKCFEKFADLIMEEVMQTLMITGHTDACDTLNNHFGFEE